MMATHHVGRALSDNRKAGVLSQENQKWLLEEWFPRASKRGFLKYAVICSEDELHNMGLESLLQQVEHSEFLIRYCESERAAIDWLKVH